MIPKLKYGKCLDLLLSALNISSNRLSKAINVDPSLISRWLHENRIPPYKSTYIKDIAEYLSQRILNSFQKERLIEIFSMMNIDFDENTDYKFAILNLLLEAQGNSIEGKKLDTNKSAKMFIKKPEIKIIHRKKVTASVISLSNEDSIIIGYENILSFAIFLIGTAIIQEYKNNIIYISVYMSGKNEFSSRDLVKYRKAFLRAIKSGWKIVFLFKLGNNLKKNVRFFNFIQPLIETGSFLPYFYKQYDNYTADKGMLVIEGTGALSCFNEALDSMEISAFYIKNNTGVSIFKSHFNQILKNHCKPLIRYYSIEENNLYLANLSWNKRILGKYYLFNSNFSMTTLPEPLYKKLLKKVESQPNILTSLNNYAKNKNLFLNNIKHYEYFEIYELKSIDTLIHNKILTLETSNEIYTVELKVLDIINYFNHLINLLEHFENYKIAFIDHCPINFKTVKIYSCIIIERQTAEINIINKNENMPRTCIFIDEPLIVKVFEEKFNNTWSQINPINRDKAEIVKFIKEKIIILQQNNTK